MLQSKYNKYRFYCHNFGNYDVYFIFNSLSLDDFKNMYLNKKSVIAIKNNTIKNISEGSVLIPNKKIILDYNSYNKREKIYDKNGIWIDTKPLNYFNDNNNEL